MKKVYLFLLVQLTFCTIAFSSSIKTDASSLKQSFIYFFNGTDTTYKIVSGANNTYGYEIVIKNKVLIRQLTIPGKPGTMGFKTEADAEKVAQLVLRKLSKGLMPPTVDEKELIKLKIKL